MEIGSVYLLETIGSKYIFEDKVWVVRDAENNTYNIPYYPFLDLIYKPGSKTPCRCIKLRRGMPDLDIDLASVYDEIYEEGCTYTFKAIELCTDSTAFTRYIKVVDEYRLEHRLYHPSSQDKASIGNEIVCKVLEIGNYSIVLESTTKHATNSSAASMEDQLQLFNDLHERRINEFAILNQADYKGVWENAIGLYPDTAHFIYELLQNADDALATKVTILLSEEGLLFKHNGTERFTVTSKEHVGVPGHINSITGIGNSAKDNAESNKIGKFGVGFKSVFQYTDCPYIYDEVFKFKIENYIIPVLLEEDHDFREAGETLFYIPFKDKHEAYEDISQKLRELGNATLFLNTLEIIDWTDTLSGQHRTFEKRVVTSYTSGSISCKQLCISDSSNEVMMWMFTRTITIKNHGEYPISVGFFLNEDGEIETQTQRKVHCFFPTDETFQTCFISHAPFLLVKSRTQILNKNEINITLVNEIGNLVADTLPELKKIKLLNSNILTILGYRKFYYHYDYDKIINPNAILKPGIEKIKKEKLLLSRNGEFLLPSAIYKFATLDLAELISSEQLQELDGRDVHVDFLCRELNDMDVFEWKQWGVREYTPELLAEQLTPGFMSKQTSAWVNRFYYQLIEKFRKLWNNVKDTSTGFLASPIILTLKGEWVTPFKHGVLNVYYQADNNDGYNIVSTEFCKNKYIKKFLDDIGCKEPDQEDYIKTKLLPKYASTEKIDTDTLVADFISIYKFAQKVEKARYEDVCRVISDAQIIIYSINGGYVRNTPREVYVDTDIIKEYFRGYDDAPIIESELYRSLIDEIGEQKFYDFLSDIGIKTCPNVCHVKKGTWELLEAQAQELKLNEIRYTWTRLTDSTIDGLANALKRGISKNVSIQIWKWLMQIGTDNFADAQAEIFYRKSTYRHFSSSAVILLRSSAWLYDSQNHRVRPKNVSVEELEMAGYPVSSSLCEALKIARKVKDLREYGLSNEENELFKLGNKLKEMGISLDNLEEFASILKEQQAKKKRQQKKLEMEQQLAELSTREELSKGTGSEFEGMNDSVHESSSAAGGGTSTKEEIEQKIQEFKEQTEKELQNKLDVAELREAVKEMPRYSKEWFDAMLTLEYGEEAENDNQTAKTISLSFGRVAKEAGSERIFVLKSPSKCPIPLAIEEISGIEVKFSFTDREDFVKGFEVASVRDFTLRLKAKLQDVDFLNSVDWSKCTKATIDANNPGKLMNKLIDAFNELDLVEGFDLKENLENNISFVFGPPGTGKTTYLANHINTLMSEESQCKILVLCPTNKACDVLTQKVYDICQTNEWLARFVATGEENIENLGLVHDRDSYIYNQDQCCVVSTMARLPYDGFNKIHPASRLKDLKWDYVIIDEASMIPLAQIVFAIYKFSPDAKIIIAGDPMQITPIVREEEWKRENIYTMVKLDRFDNPQTEPIQFEIRNLETQYRSLPAIGRVFSEYAYAGLLNHHRAEKDETAVKLNLPDMPLKPLNLIPFRVSRMDDVFRPYKLSGSNVHIYSVLLIVELCKYISKEYANQESERILKIGIICPYVAEAQMIEKLIEQISNLPPQVDIHVGTIHGFQGDECDVIFVVLNPPVGLKGAADRVFLNDKNIINVAISRARDYLFVLYPHQSTDGFDKLREMKTLGRIMYESGRDVMAYTCDEIERIIFGKPFYIENNAFVTTHQLANVYTEGAKKYEVRIDVTSVDVQISEDPLS